MDLNKTKEFFSMNELDDHAFRELQLKCLDILVYFKKICDENKLTFYLAGGTAIGALRHKGFIPWDEDIDVFMPRPDYEKLTKLWDRVADTDKYIFCRSSKDVNFHHGAASIMDITTTFIEERNKNTDIPQGIVMDVIPLDGCPDNWFARKLQFFYALVFSLFNNQRLPENKSKMIYNISKYILKVIRGKKTRDIIWMHAEKKMTKYDFYSNHDISELIGQIIGMKAKHPVEDFIQTVDVEFEGHLMPIMKGYDAYLTSVFGNYMELPPKEHRFPKTNLVYMNLYTSYKEFKGIYYCTD